jgi:Flp pilus assembly protein TadG
MPVSTESAVYGKETTPQRDERGASVLEFAMIAPVLFMLVLGIFTGSQAYNQKLSLTSAAREGGRWGATQATNGVTNATWLANVAAQVENRANGDLAPSVSNRTLCVAIIPPSTSTSPSQYLLWTTSDSGTVANGTCPGTTVSQSSTDQQVQVVVKRSATLDTMLFQQTVTLSATSVGRWEG